MVRIKYQRREFANKPALPFGLQLERFTDDSGRVYSWAPHWDDVREIFIAAAATELFNIERSGKWGELTEFENVAKHTIEMIQQAAKRLDGQSTTPA